jgi:hypothetical protein
MRQAGRGEAGILGPGAACLACCAGPILAFLGGLGIAGLASILFIGGAGLAVAAAVAAAFVVVRRRSRCAVADESPVVVAAPARRAPLS